MTTLRNSVKLIGRLGMEPEIKVIGKDQKMARFSLATKHVYYNAKGEKVEETDWHNIKAFGKVVDIIEKFVKKGQEIALEGRLNTTNWEDKDGKKRQSFDIILSELVLLQKAS